MAGGIVRCIDIEGTGLHVGALACEYGWRDFDPAACALLGGGAYLCRVPDVPPDVRAVHHIRAAETQGFPPYDRRAAYEAAVRAGVTAWAAYNADYEARFIANGLPLICLYKAALRMYPEAPSHKLFGVLYWLEDQGRVDLSDLDSIAHRAGTDASAAAILMAAMVADGATGKDFMRWTQEPRLMPTVPIDKRWRGQPWSAPDDGWLEWVLRTICDDEDLCWNARCELDRRYDERARCADEMGGDDG